MVDEKAAKMERHLLETQFPLECEEIPLDDLTADEKIVVIKCMDHQELDDTEFKLLKKTLQRYREAIYEIRPTETIESMEKTIKIINTEQEFLDILDNPELKFLKVHLPFEGELYEFNFEILPLDNSAALKGVGAQLEIFKDFSKKEAQIFTKAQAGQVLSREEESILKKVNDELEKRMGEHQEEIIEIFLANQLRLPNSSENIEERKYFWKRFSLNAKTSVFIRLQDRLGLTEYSNEQLFPSSN